jgi:hypothetical protein
MEQGRIVFSGTPVDLSALGSSFDSEAGGHGQSAIERGYGAALTSARGGSGYASRE